MIKSFRGMLEDGGQDTIPLSTIQGKVGYRIVKFEIMPQAPGTIDYESGIMIWKNKQSSVSTATLNIDFANNRLLGAAYILMAAGATQGNNSGTTIFDNEIVNQDIYITHTNVEGSGAAGNMNYYIELEQFVLNSDEAAVATLKDIRNTATV